MKFLIAILVSTFALNSFAVGTTPQLGVKAATETITETSMRFPLHDIEVRRAAFTVYDMISSVKRAVPIFSKANAVATKLEPNLARELIRVPGSARERFLATPQDWTVVIINRGPSIQSDELMTQIGGVFLPSKIDDTSQYALKSEITIHGKPADMLYALQQLEVGVPTIPSGLRDIQVAGIKRKGVTSKLIVKGNEFALNYEQAVRVVPAQNASAATIVAPQVRR